MMKRFFLLSSLVMAQCKPDVLVDDFKRANLSALVIETPPPLRYFNLMGGDYGIKEEGKSNISLFPSPTNGYLEFLADW
jgi:hypothetical protein